VSRRQAARGDGKQGIAKTKISAFYAVKHARRELPLQMNLNCPPSDPGRKVKN
jgi:hypothetical protein